MKKFEPSSTYIGLLKQANALYTLALYRGYRISTLNNSIEELTLKYNAIGPDVLNDLNAEREINSQLTNYVEELEEKIEKLEKNYCPTSGR